MATNGDGGGGSIKSENMVVGCIMAEVLMVVMVVKGVVAVW